MVTALHLLSPPPWDDYELLDSGHGLKWERFGAYTLVRPENQALWAPGKPAHEWEKADAVFRREGGGRRSVGDDRPGNWILRRQLPERWLIEQDALRLWVRLTPFRHTGIFPEQRAWWSWIRQQVHSAPATPEVLVLFGYTGVASLVAAQAGARVCHVDASRPAIRWARENQDASGMSAYPIRWIEDDVLKFVRREQRRGSRYDLIMMDPPVFGRGPRGEIWRFPESLPTLVNECVRILHDHPVGFLINAYATPCSALSLAMVLEQAMRPFGGEVVAGELVLRDNAAGHTLSCGLYASWSATRHHQAGRERAWGSSLGGRYRYLGA